MSWFCTLQKLLNMQIMKTPSIILLAFVCTSSLAAKSLQDCSILLWPKFNWIGSNVEAVANEKFREGDFIVYPGALGMKGWFRSETYQIDPARVMIQLDHDTMNPSFYHYLEKNQEGIGGVFVTEFVSDSRSALGKSNRRRFYEYLGRQDQELVYCVDKQSVDRPANLDFLGKGCDQLIIYFDRGLLLDPQSSVAFFKRALARARLENEDIEILAGVELKQDGRDVDHVIALFEAISDQIDGILLVFEGSADQNASAVRLVNQLRS